MTGNSLINFGDLSKPVTVLIEKISDAIGGFAKPWQIRRVASAEAEAEKTKALARIEITDVEHRALVRRIHEDGKQQENIEAITLGAIPHVEDAADPAAIEPDWFTQFFDRAKMFSNLEIQGLWSRVLAGEANKPGSYSLRTLDFLAKLDRKDAELFTKFCSCVWQLVDLEAFLVQGHNFDEHVKVLNLNFTDLMHLQDIGLISFDNMAESVYLTTKENFVFYYYGAKVSVDISTSEKKGDNFMVRRGNVSLTKIGRELAVISGSSPSYAYFERALSYWIDKNVRVSAEFASRESWLAIQS